MADDLSADDRALAVADAWASIWVALALTYGGDPAHVLAMHRKYFAAEHAAAGNGE